MKKFIIIGLFALISTFPGCQDSDDTPLGPIPVNAFRYTSFDQNGKQIVEGWLTLEVDDSLRITGEWHLAAIGNPQNIGPQVGSGNLVGGVNQEKTEITWVELNPQYRDNNLQLIGILKDKTYSGEWVWISFAGISAQGTFRAVRH